jgi:hypothetical protein
MEGEGSMTDVKTTETDPMELVREARAHANDPGGFEEQQDHHGKDLLEHLADELETALDAARLANEAFTTAIKQRDEAAAAERRRIAGDIWTEEQKASNVLYSHPEKIGTPEYSDIGSRIAGLQRARDIANGEGPKP